MRIEWLKILKSEIRHFHYTDYRNQRDRASDTPQEVCLKSLLFDFWCTDTVLGTKRLRSCDLFSKITGQGLKSLPIKRVTRSLHTYRPVYGTRNWSSISQSHCSIFSCSFPRHFSAHHRRKGCFFKSLPDTTDPFSHRSDLFSSLSRV